MLKNALVVVLAIATALGLAYVRSWFVALWNPPPGWEYFGPETWLHATGNAVLRALINLLPGFIVGACLSSRRILAGGLVSVLGAALTMWVNNPVYFKETLQGPDGLGTALYAGLHGAAGAALGLVALSSYKSFKASRALRKA